MGHASGTTLPELSTTVFPSNGQVRQRRLTLDDRLLHEVTGNDGVTGGRFALVLRE